MPIFQDPDKQLPGPFRTKELTAPNDDMRRPSEDSIRTERCEGPVPDTQMEDSQKHHEDAADTASSKNAAVCSDRAELMERIKRGESPTWVPNPALQEEYFKTNGEFSARKPRSPKNVTRSLSLLPAVELQDSPSIHEDVLKDRISDAMGIQRPRSALHAGDFTEGPARTAGRAPDSPLPIRQPLQTQSTGPLGASPTTPWYSPGAPPREGLTQRSFWEMFGKDVSDRRSSRSRAPSLSSFSSSSYVLKAPTTPLVQQSNNTDLDFSTRERSASPDKNTRRHTLPMHAFNALHTSSPIHTPSVHQLTANPHSASFRREASFPYSHQSRRSLTSNWSLQQSTSPPTPAFLRSRRTSFSSEASPLQHASMVGSYEESILRGWMSTAPSKPFDFTAQIGVLGKGDCKPKCPAHVTIPFPAVFYSWGASNGRSSINDEPSPYVGHIDLQHSLAPSEPEAEQKYPPQAAKADRDIGSSVNGGASESAPRMRKRRRRTSPPPTPPGGSYRIPQQGQLQIIIKNPNKTAVKLFLVPYDLTGMETGTKTFVRQRLYSAGPIMESPLASKSLLTSETLNDTKRKPTLRYLVHLNICSPSKGRFFLYQQIRVVFANRVPDNKEQLRTEIQVPEPKFSVWKPQKDLLLGQTSAAGAKLTAEKAYRRRSSGFGFSGDSMVSWPTRAFTGGSTFVYNGREPAPPVPPIPFHIPSSKQRPSPGDPWDVDGAMDVDTSRPATTADAESPLGSRSACEMAGIQPSGSYRSHSSQGSDGYGKLRKSDSGYGGVFGRPATPEPGEGLLARRLRGLGVQRDARPDDET